MIEMTSEQLYELMAEIEAKDHTTASHTWRVVLYTRALAELAGMDPESLASFARAAALHDIGKLDIPPEILNKKGKLTAAEFAIVKSHPVLGYDRLVSLGVDDPIILNLVRHHHEQWDGKGYPDHLKGNRVPIAARFFSVIDAFDAMTSVRSYRMDIGKGAADRAISELRRSVGSRYCAGCVGLFEELYQSGQIDWVLNYHNSDAELEQHVTEALKKNKAA